MDRRIVIVLALISVVGCRPTASQPFPEWVQNAPQSEEMGNSTAYTGYCKAAQLAETSAGKLGDQMRYTPGVKKSLQTKLSPAIDTLRKSAKVAPLGYRFVPNDPAVPSLHCKGWALIGKVLVWRIEQNGREGKLDQAIDDTLLATNFGFDLLAGSGMEASLGLTIVDDSRRAMTAHLGKLGAGQLGRLSDGLVSILRNRPRITTTLENERLNMRAGVQLVQDAFQKNELDELEVRLGTGVGKAVDYLKVLRQKGDADRVAYFQGFADETDTVAKYWIEQSAKPAGQRDYKNGKPAIKLAENRPWKRFSGHFMSTPEPLLAQFDSTVARTRLLAIESGLTKIVKTQGYAPQDLAKFDEISTDPYSGREFAYHRDGKSFKIYSIGPDFRDNGGQTDEAFRTPDVTLERGT